MIDHEPHVSDLRWDLLLAGDLPEATQRTVHNHAAQCATCATRLRELTAGRDAFRRQPMMDLVAARSPHVEVARPPGLAPAYRDDIDAARARCASLEGELRATGNQLARLNELTRDLGASRAGHRDGPDYTELEDQVVALQRELRDLTLLGRGDEAINEEIAAIERRANDRRGRGELELHVAGARARALAGPVWAPRHRRSRTARGVVATIAAALGLVPVAWGASVAFEASKTVIPAWGESAVDIALWFVVLVVAGWFCAIGLASVLAAIGAARREARAERSLVGPDELCGRPWSTAEAIRFDPTELVVSFSDRDLVFDRSNPHFPIIVDYARAAAFKYRLDLDDPLPALPQVGSDG